MIEYIKGELTELTPALATIETAGIGYGLNISLNTFSAIQGKKEVKLYVYESIREDAHLLYGFINKICLAFFLIYWVINVILQAKGIIKDSNGIETDNDMDTLFFLFFRFLYK